MEKEKVVSVKLEYFTDKGVNAFGFYENSSKTASIGICFEAKKKENKKRINEILRPYGYKVYGWGYYTDLCGYIFKTNMPIDEFVEVFSK